MPISKYQPEKFDILRDFAFRAGVPSLAERRFVDHYYGSRESCCLHLFMNDGGELVGTMGVEQMHFRFGEKEMMIGIPSNYHALQPGAGGYLYLQWMKKCPFGLEFGGSEDAHEIIRKQSWKYFAGIKSYILNYDYPLYAGNKWPHRLAKRVLRGVRRKKIAEYASNISSPVRSRISVHEEKSYTEDLLPRNSSFEFRLSPTLDYLQWRYNLALSFVHYRLFRITEGGRTSGYAILSDHPDKVIVAQCDGDDPVVLGYGVLLSLLEVARDDVGPRTVLLLCSNPQMQMIYGRFGFGVIKGDFLFAMGSLREQIDIPDNTSRWLINYDWGDNGLLGPFLGQSWQEELLRFKALKSSGTSPSIEPAN